MLLGNSCCTWPGVIIKERAWVGCLGLVDVDVDCVREGGWRRGQARPGRRLRGGNSNTLKTPDREILVALEIRWYSLGLIGHQDDVN